MIDRMPCDHGRDARGVCYRGRRLDGADPASVRVEHFSQYAVDRAAVFREVERITGADPDSFVRLIRNYGRDARRAYWRARPIADADVAAFVAVGDLYAKGGRRVHHAGSRSKAPIRRASSTAAAARPHMTRRTGRSRGGAARGSPTAEARGPAGSSVAFRTCLHGHKCAALAALRA